MIALLAKLCVTSLLLFVGLAAYVNAKYDYTVPKWLTKVAEVLLVVFFLSGFSSLMGVVWS